MMSFKVAGPPQQPTTSKRITDISKETPTMLSPTPSTSSTMSSTVQESSNMKMGKLFDFIDDTYRDIKCLHSGLHKGNYNNHLMQAINKYKNGCNKIFEDVLESHEMSKKLAQNIVRTIDIFKELCTSLTDLEEYQHRICEMMAIFIACELRLSVDTTIEEQLLISQRIVYIMRRHLVQEVEEDSRYNILRTLVYIPRLFNARNIMCAIFGQFIPMKPASDVNVFSDKLYMLYIIVFYRWMMMQKDDDDKLLIVNFAESFMKPSVTLCTNKLYATHLPRYTMHSTATRTILNNMTFYRDIRNASIIDNAMKIGSIVDLCDDDDEDADLIILGTSSSTEFAEIFSSVQLMRLDESISHIKLEEETIIDTVDLTAEDEEVPINSPKTIFDSHEKWLNNFQQLAKQYRESQIIIERQQNSQHISNKEKEIVICLDSDSEIEEEEISAANVKKGTSMPPVVENNEKSNELIEDLFADNYPPTVTPINCGTDLESSDVEDDTKLSSRFLDGNLRTYQAKKVHQIKSQANIDRAYRRDSIHISSSPPDNPDDECSDNQEDDGTDVQDEHDQDEDEVNSWSSITLENHRPRGPYPTYNSMQIDKVVFSQSLTRLAYDKEHQSQSSQNHSQKEEYNSDGLDVKTNKKQKKKVQFSTSLEGPTSITSPVQNKTLKPSLQQSKNKAFDATDYFHIRSSDHLTNMPYSTAGSTSTCSTVSAVKASNKQQEQQEHIAAAKALFSNVFGYQFSAPFSPSSSSVSSKSLISPATPVTPSKTRKPSIKNRRPTMGAIEDLIKDNSEQIDNKEKQYSIIRNREVLEDSHHSSGLSDTSRYTKYDDRRLRETSDDYYGAASDTDIIKNDVKLRKRCSVVIRPTKELLQYERKRAEFYNELLQKQRRKLELRALEKKREKEHRRLTRRDENGDLPKVLNEKSEQELSATSVDKRDSTRSINQRNYSAIFMSNESEFETNFQVRTRKQKQQNVKELHPLRIQIGMTESTTSLLNEIDACLDKPIEEAYKQKDELKQQQQQDKSIEQQLLEEPMNKTVNQHKCDITNDTGQTKMRELNLLADIAEQLSPYQSDIPANNNPPQSSTTPPPSPLPAPIDPVIPAHQNLPSENKEKSNICKDSDSKNKPIVTEQLFIQSFENLLEKSQHIKETEKEQEKSQQEHAESAQQETHETHDYAHEPKLNVAAIFNSSPENLLKNPQRSTLINNVEISASNNVRNEKSNNSLEQILEESIKSVTSPFNSNNECSASSSAQTPNESSLSLLISNVESLNHLQHNSLTDGINLQRDVGKNTEEVLLQNEGHHLNNFMNKLTNETKDINEKVTNFNTISTLLSTVEPSIISGDLSNISSEMEMSNNFKESTVTRADLSDISLESEPSKHLPEIAEPSPVVTDISDNSNESDVSKSFSQNNYSHSAAIESTDIPVMNLPDLPLLMPTIPPPSTPMQLSQDTSIPMTSSTPTQLENDINPLNSTLNTPIKQPSLPDGGDRCATQLRTDLITPLKFTIQSEIESDDIPLKSALEPESDNNVTKFLDLILNKTVTDAESETRDKIIKELNALTAADTSTTESAEQDGELTTQEPEIEGNNKTIHSDVTIEGDDKENTVQNPIDEHKLLDPNKISKNENANEDNLQKNKLNDNLTESLDNSKVCHNEEKIEDSCNTSIEHNSKTSFVESNHIENQTIREDTSVVENVEIYPPKPNSMKETSVSINNTEIISNKLNFETSNAENKMSPVKQTFNIKCRVRLKRLNVAQRYKSSKKETWIAMPVTKPEESGRVLNDISTCDNNSKTETTSLFIKKPCLKGRKLSATEVTSAKKLKLDVDDKNLTEKVLTSKDEEEQQVATHVQTSNTSVSEVLFNNNTTLTTKIKSKNAKTVTFDLSNLNEETKNNISNHKPQKLKGHICTPVIGGSVYQKNSRSLRKLPENTLRAAETLQIFVNTINDSARTPTSVEFNRKHSPVKNKCIADNETPHPPLPSTLMDTLSCKKTCTEKSRSQITSSKCKDQLVSSLVTPSISNITSDITTARIYTSSPLDQTLPEYDVDNVDTVADSELILPTTTGSLRRKLKKPKKSLIRPEPVDDINPDDISTQPECNGDDDTDAVVDNEDDVFVEQLLPIPAANEHILEEIVSARPPHIGTGSVIRDDYMNIEATATVPVYLFNDESRDLATPEPIQSSDANVVDSSSYLNPPSAAANISANTSTTATIGNLQKSMLSPSEHEVSSTQETFYQTPTKSRQIETLGEKSMTNKEKSSNLSNAINNPIKADDKSFQNKQDDQTSSTTGLLQNNQVDTTNHSPEMCTLTLTGSTSSSTATTLSNRKIRKASTHDEILFNELQQQQQQQKSIQQSKRKTMFCAESTSDSSNIVKNKIVSNNLDDIKTNGSLGKIEHKFKKLLKEGENKGDNTEIVNKDGSLWVGNISLGGGGSSPSTTTTINEEKSSKSKRKKSKSSKSEKTKHHDRTSKIILKASKLEAHVPANFLKITIPKSRILRPPTTLSPPPSTQKEELNESIITDNNIVDKSCIDKEKSGTMAHNNNNNCALNAESLDSGLNDSSNDKHSFNSPNSSALIDTKTIILDSDTGKLILNASASIAAKNSEKTYFSNLSAKKKTKKNNNTDNLCTTANSTQSSTFATTATNCSNNINNSNSIFVKDKYDLIKNKDKYHQNLQENKDKLGYEIKKNDNHSKNCSTSNNSTNRRHKTLTKEKTREKHSKVKRKTLDETMMTPSNVFKFIEQRNADSNLSSSSITLSPSARLPTTFCHPSRNSGSKSSKNKTQDLMNGSTSSSNTTAVLKSKANLSVSSQLPSTSGVATQTIITSPSATTPAISTNHVRKKLKTK